MDRLIRGERGFQHRNVQVRLTIEIWDFLDTGSIVIGVVEPFLCFGTTAYCLRLFHRRNFGSFRRAWVRRSGDLENRRSRALGQHLGLYAVERLSLPSLLDEWSLHGPLFLRLNTLAPLVRGSKSRYSVFWKATHVSSATERVAKGLGEAQEGKVSSRSREWGIAE